MSEAKYSAASVCIWILDGELWRRGPVGDDCPLKRELRFNFVPPINHACFVEALMPGVFLLFILSSSH